MCRCRWFSSKPWRWAPFQGLNRARACGSELGCNIRFGHGSRDRRGRHRMTPSIPRICIAMGDPAGISPEVLAKLLARGDLMELACVCVVGDRRVLAEGGTIAGAKSDIAVLALAAIEAATPGKPVFVDLRHLDPASIRRGEASAASGGFAMRNFREARLPPKAA